MTYMAEIDATAKDARKGDWFTIINANGSDGKAFEIETVQTGTKWTVARGADGMLIFRRLNDEQTWLIRETKTEEELAADKAEAVRQAAQFRIEMLEKLHVRLHDGVVAARAALTARLAEPTYYVSASMMEDLAMEQEYKTIALQIDAGLEHHPEWTVVDCMTAVADRIKEGLIDGRNEPTQSGGFTFSNADRAVKIAAQRKFIQGINWGIL
jgi:hypothetical protein